VRNRLLCLLLKNCNFLNIDISQSSVSTRLGCGVFKYDFVTNLLLSLTVKEFRKSVNHRRNYGQEYSVLFFFDSQCTLYYYYYYGFSTSDAICICSRLQLRIC